MRSIELPRAPIPGGSRTGRTPASAPSRHPPPLRVEWLIGCTRMAVAAGTVIDLVVRHHVPSSAVVWLTSYCVYAVGLLALIWKPVRFTAGWGIVVQSVDVIALSMYTVFAMAPASPVLIYFVFLVISGTLRWQSLGALWTAAGTILTLVAATVYGSEILGIAVDYELLVTRCVHFAGAAALVGYLGTYSHLGREMSRAALWPRKLPHHLRGLVADIIARATTVLDAPCVLLVWTEPNKPHVNIAWQANDNLVWIREPRDTYGTLVAPELTDHSFQAVDASNTRGAVTYWAAPERLRHRRCRAVDAQLAKRFGMRGVQSYPLEGEFIQGRLFCFGKRRMHIDDLLIGDLVARLAVSHFDSVYLVAQLGETAAAQERLRLARDLHDSLAQTLAGTALQLLAARRLLDFDPVAARDQLGEVQHHMKRDQLELRALIRRLRPGARAAAAALAEADEVTFHERVEQLRARVEKQWGVRLSTQLEASVDAWSEIAVEHVYHLLQEAVLNAARHADASVIRVEVTNSTDVVRLAIEDDGKGYPIHGTFDLATLMKQQQGPLTLRERVAELRGDLLLETSSIGTRVLITLPTASLEM